MRIPIRLIPQGVIVRDPKMVFRIERAAPAVAPAVAATVVVGMPYLDTFGGSGSLDGRISDSGHTYPNVLDPSAAVSGGMLRAASTDAYIYAAIDPAPLSADYFVRLSVLSEGWATYLTNQVAIYLRSGGFPESFYVAVINTPVTPGGPVGYYIIKMVAGVTTSLVTGGTVLTADADEGMPFDFYFGVSGSTLTLKFGTTVYETITDADVTQIGRIFIDLEGGEPDWQDSLAILTAEADVL